MSYVPNEQVARLSELGLLTASLLHELRQPLMSVQATAELALSSTPTDRRWERVLTAAQHMSELLELHSGIGRVDEPAVRVDLAASVHAAIGMLEPRRKALDASISVLPSSLPVCVRGRETAFRQLVVNLVHNALDAVEGQPDRRVTLTLAREGDARILRVSDTGCGIPDTLRETIFEPFVTGKPLGAGTGLGLFLAREITTASGGTLGLIETSPSGTVFEARWSERGD